MMDTFSLIISFVVAIEAFQHRCAAVLIASRHLCDQFSMLVPSIFSIIHCFSYLQKCISVQMHQAESDR